MLDKNLNKKEASESSVPAVRQSLLNKRFELQFAKASPQKILLTLGICAVPIGIGVCFIQVPIGCACGNSAFWESSNFIRVQKSYFAKHQIFGKSVDEVIQEYYEDPAATAKRESTGYQFSFEVEQDQALMYATPKVVFNDLFKLGLSQAKIPGVVAAVIYNPKQKALVSKTCIANLPNSGKPSKPTFKAGKIICPDGFDDRNAL